MYIAEPTPNASAAMEANAAISTPELASFLVEVPDALVCSVSGLLEAEALVAFLSSFSLSDFALVEAFAVAFFLSSALEEAVAFDAVRAALPERVAVEAERLPEEGAGITEREPLRLAVAVEPERDGVDALALEREGAAADAEELPPVAGRGAAAAGAPPSAGAAPSPPAAGAPPSPSEGAGAGAGVYSGSFFTVMVSRE